MTASKTLVALALAGAVLVPSQASAQNRRLTWPNYGRNPQHTAVGDARLQSLQQIHWQTPVDLAPQHQPGTGNLNIHYGSPLATRRNTIIVPVKTGATSGFRVEARRGFDGSLIWSQDSDWVPPPHDWVPSFSPSLARTKLWIPGAGGTVVSRTRADLAQHARIARFAFYGSDVYDANPAVYDGAVFINTPLTIDKRGNVYFGFQVTGATPLGLVSGIARVTSRGVGTWVSAADAAADAAMMEVPHNSAPALSADGKTLYVAVSSGNGWGIGRGYLLALDAKTLTTVASVPLKDPKSGNDAFLHDDGSASPTVGPDGHVYFGVIENPLGSNHFRGWLLHFTAALQPTGAIGAFGWDDTPSIVPAGIVPSYAGTSKYLVMTKYNNYAGAGGDGVNRLAVLDPNDAVLEPISGFAAMREVLTIAGPTPDDEFPNKPNAVREWCINTGAVDPASGAVLVNNEDGMVYRWDLATNILSETVVLTAGIGEAYTPTIIGPDGTGYAINDATLFAVGE